MTGIAKSELILSIISQCHTLLEIADRTNLTQDHIRLMDTDGSFGKQFPSLAVENFVRPDISSTDLACESISEVLSASVKKFVESLLSILKKAQTKLKEGIAKFRKNQNDLKSPATEGAIFNSYGLNVDPSTEAAFLKSSRAEHDDSGWNSYDNSAFALNVGMPEYRKIVGLVKKLSLDTPKEVSEKTLEDWLSGKGMSSLIADKDEMIYDYPSLKRQTYPATMGEGNWTYNNIEKYCALYRDIDKEFESLSAEISKILEMAVAELPSRWFKKIFALKDRARAKAAHENAIEYCKLVGTASAMSLIFAELLPAPAALLEHVSDFQKANKK